MTTNGPAKQETRPSLSLPAPKIEVPITQLPISRLPMSVPMRKFLGQLADDPARAIRDRRRLAPKYCHGYFDLCDANSLECDRSALARPEIVIDPALVAVRLTEASGDRHLVNRSLGVLAHAHLAVEQPIAALAVLESYRRQALACCRPCRAEWLRRHGDYLVEVRDASQAHWTLDRSLRATEGVDAARRVGFVHGICHHYLGQRDAALENELRVLETMDLTSPRAYFQDAIAMLAIFLRGAGPEHDRLVLQRLGQFRLRIQHVRDFETVRVYQRWVEGQLEARLGDFVQARKRLDRVRRYLMERGPLRQAVAATLDLALIYCRHEYGDNYRTVRSMLRSCQSRIPEGATGEEAMLRDGLASLREVLDEDPEDQAIDAIVTLRSSFVVAVPGIVAERLGGGREIVLVA